MKEVQPKIGKAGEKKKSAGGLGTLGNIIKSPAIRGVVLVGLVPAAIGGTIKEAVIEDSSVTIEDRIEHYSSPFEPFHPEQEYAIKTGLSLVGLGYWVHSYATRNRQMEGAQKADKNQSAIGLDIQGLGIATILGTTWSL